jgi:hypothetical protein
MLTVDIASGSSSVSSATLREMPRPALFTQTSMRPKRSIAAFARALDVAPLGDVGDDRERLLADSLGNRVELLLATRREDDLGPLGCELLRELRPDSCARARDDDDFVHGALFSWLFGSWLFGASSPAHEPWVKVECASPLDLPIGRLALRMR